MKLLDKLSKWLGNVLAPRTTVYKFRSQVEADKCLPDMSKVFKKMDEAFEEMDKAFKKLNNL